MCGSIGVGHAGRGQRGGEGDSLEFNLRFIVSLHVLTREVLNAQRDVERLANLVIIRLVRRRHLCVLSLVSPFLIPPLRDCDTTYAVAAAFLTARQRSTPRRHSSSSEKIIAPRLLHHLNIKEK